MPNNLSNQAVRITGIRSVIAKRMVESLASAAQLTYFADADITGLLASREEWKNAGQSVGIEDCIIYAIARSLSGFPDFNATLEEDMFARSDAINMSVAISSPTGLMTPVVRGVEQLSLSDIAEKRRDLVTRALEGRLEVEDMKGGTFTVSNLGLTRVRHFTPILNRPQVALLGIGRIEEVAKQGRNGRLDWRKVVGLSLTADHRILDGDPSGRFLAALCEGLENFDGQP